VIMEFTRQELKSIERLRRYDRQWPRTRWVLLAMGIVLLICAGVLGFLFSRMLVEIGSPQPDSAEVALISLIVVKILLSMIFGAWGLMRAILYWHGDAKQNLLLKLLDAQQRQNPPSQYERESGRDKGSSAS